MTIKVLVAAEVDAVFHETIARDDRFAVRIEPAYSSSDLARAIGSAEILVTRAHNVVTSEVLDSATRLRLIVQGTSGLDNIDEAAATRRGIAIVGIPGENANAVAELVIGHLVTLTRTVQYYDRMIRGDHWDRSDCATRNELRGHRLGIIGLGRVGSQVVKLASVFGVTSSAYDPYITDDDFRKRGAQRVESPEELLARSDVVSLHVPLTNETRGMIGAAELDTLPAGAIVVNTARGAVLDVKAALTRLESGRLSGLAIDVYEEEPPSGIDWPDHPGLILTPHIAGCSRESKAAIGRLLYEEICAWAERESQKHSGD